MWWSMLTRGNRSNPEKPGLPRSGHSRTTARSKLRSKPDGSSLATVMVSMPGRKPRVAGWGSRLKMAVLAPICAASSAKPNSEPMASPSGAACDVMSTRLACRTRVTAAAGSRVTSLIAAALILARALSPVPRDVVEDALDAVGPLEPLVAPELELRRVVDAHAPPAFVPEEAAGLLE